MKSGAGSLISILAAGASLLPSPLEGQAHFHRGDANHDMVIDLSDVSYTLEALFLAGLIPPCEDAADFNDDGAIDVSDAVAGIGFLFRGGSPPAPPWPVFEADPTADLLGCLGPPVFLEGDLTQDRLLSRQQVYLLGRLFVREGVTLRIEEGTTILGDRSLPDVQFLQSVLVVERGGRIEAVGTRTHPVVFTSARPVGERRRGDWYGIGIHGRGDSNLTGKEGVSSYPGSQVWGGGDAVDPADMSGRLSYVRIEYAGREFLDESRASALDLLGVGAGTRIDHLQLKQCNGDAVHLEGGSTFLKHILVTGPGDDCFDYSFGWTGGGQFWACQQRGDQADRGIEGDNTDVSMLMLPLTRPTISNITLIGDPDTNEGTKSTEGLYFRRGVGTVLYNAIVQGFKVAGLDIDDGITTDNNPTNGNLIVDYCLFYENGPAPDRNMHFRTGETGIGGNGEETEANGFAYSSLSFGTVLNTHNIQVTQPPTVDPYNPINANFRPQNHAVSSGLNPGSVLPGFEPAPYYGAVPPVGPDWTREPWISYLAE